MALSECSQTFRKQIIPLLHEEIVNNSFEEDIINWTPKLPKTEWERKLQPNLPHENRCKNSEQILSNQI